MVVAKTKPKTPLIPRKIRKILSVLKKGLVKIYGDQLKALYLFGSFARGEGTLPDSDIDVMIVLKGEFDRREVEKRSINFVTSLCLEYDVVVSWFFASDAQYIQSKMPFILNVRKDAVTI
jgi:predicted nucleotidyltransferase